MPTGSLHTRTSGSGPTLVLVHGFTQSGGAWGPVDEALAERFTVVAVDAPGHGASAGVQSDLCTGADLMAEALPGPAAWLGYSMGGRFCLHVALRHPSLTERLVLVSTTAGIDDPAERRARRDSDGRLAARVEEEGVEPFVRWWVRQPLFETLPPSAAAMEGRLGGSAAGLASSLRLAGTGTMQPLWDDLHRLEMPVLVVAGELDPKYRAAAERLAASVGPNASLSVISGAGHACHLERPKQFVDTVVAWLDRE